MKHMKDLYDNVLNWEKVLNPSMKKLVEVIGKTNEEEAAGQVFGFMAFLTPEDLKSLWQLNELMGHKFDFSKASTVQFM